MAKPPGYLLPSGECYTEEMACALVFYPDKPEYRRALYGSLVYLSTWLAWERDVDKRGKDAARAWKDATDLTMECMNMACLEELIADVAQIRHLMETRKDCCDSNADYYPPTIPPTGIDPGVGDPPDEYGETVVTDWDDWAEHVCYNAHLYVDYLKNTAGELSSAVSLASIFIGLISASLSLLAFAGLVLAIPYTIAAAVVAGIVLGATISTFSNTADDIEAARLTIVCAIVKGYSLSDAIESALSSGTDWDLFYQFVDYESAIAILYEGGYNEEYLPTETRDDCDCEGNAHFEFDFAVDADGWTSVPLTYLWDVGQFITGTPSNTGQWKYADVWTWSNLATRFSFALPVAYDQVKFKFQNFGDGGPGNHHLFQVKIFDGDNVPAISPEYDTDDFTDNEWHEIIWNLDETFSSGTNANNAIRVRMYRYGAAGSRRMWIDDFGIWKKS